MRRGSVVGAALSACLLFALPVAAQDPCPSPPGEPEPRPPVRTGSLGAGLALTQGNTDTTNTNVSFDVKRDAQAQLVDGLPRGPRTDRGVSC